MVSSCLPIHRGVYCTTLVGVISTCVGNSRLPRLMRLARKTSPAANGSPLRQIHTTRTTKIVATIPIAQYSATALPDSPAITPDVKLFPANTVPRHSQGVDRCRTALQARRGTPERGF